MRIVNIDTNASGRDDQAPTSKHTEEDPLITRRNTILTANVVPEVSGKPKDKSK